MAKSTIGHVRTVAGDVVGKLGYVAPEYLETGKCADFLGIKVELLRLLDDSSLRLMIPHLDRVIVRNIIPRHWRTATVTAELKPGKDESNPASFRPISVVPTLMKP